jgi:hypothetical protein
MPADVSARTTHTKKEKCNELETTATGEEELNCAEVPGGTPVQIGRRKKMAKKLKGILIEINGGVVSYVQFNGKPVTTYHLLDWDELLSDGDTCRAWEGVSTEEQEFIRGRLRAP